MGEGGPYRQFFADVSQELQPMGAAAVNNTRCLSLLTKSPNNLAGFNIGKGKYVIAPARSGSYDLSLFDFLGILMGVCVRTGSHMNLDLP